MENATKALLIAAAVLIVIVIIALGVRLIGTTKQTSTQMDTVKSEVDVATKATADGLKDSLSKLNESDEVQRFNSQYMHYAGKQKGSKVKEVIELVKQNNTTNTNYIEIAEENRGNRRPGG